MTAIDLNADMGESYGRWSLGADEELMQYISSANVACGFHAGDPSVMTRTVALAKAHGVSVGAHPSYPDLPGFGRRSMNLSRDEVSGAILYQLGALWAFLRVEAMDLGHVKPHGALYNDASREPELAAAIAEAVRKFSRELPLYCLPGSCLEVAAHEAGLLVCREGFADRRYEPSGRLVDRAEPGAVLGVDEATIQAVSLAGGQVAASDGSPLRLSVATLCIHGDSPDAVVIAARVQGALMDLGYDIRPPRSS